MYVILPHDIDGISELEKRLAGADLSTILTQLPQIEVIVTMPKFKLEETTDLNDILTEVSINGCMTACVNCSHDRAHLVI
jgi:serine protease inhibitor